MRDELQSYLQITAVADGREAADIGSHSLRIGGATAMAHVVGDLSRVQRFGRWPSDALHVYVWDGHETMSGVAKRMAGDTYEFTNLGRGWRANKQRLANQNSCLSGKLQSA